MILVLYELFELDLHSQKQTILHSESHKELAFFGLVLSEALGYFPGYEGKYTREV